MVSEEIKTHGSDFKHVWRTLKVFLTPHRAGLFTAFVLLVVVTLCETALPYILGQIIDSVTTHPLKKMFLLWCGIYLFITLLKSIFVILHAFLIQKSGQSITHRIREQLVEKALSLPISYYDTHPTGRLLTRLVNDVKTLGELFTASMSTVLMDVFIITATLIAMFWLNWRLSLAVLVTFPFLVLGVRWFGHRMAMSYRKVRQRLSEINAFLGENIGAIATIQRLFAQEERMKSFGERVDHHYDAQMESLRTFSLVQPVTNLLNGAAIAGLIGFGGYLVIHNEITIGLFAAFLAYIRNLFQPIRNLVEKYSTFLSAFVSAERVVALLDEPSETSVISVGKGQFGSNQKTASLEIRFDRVRFRYPKGEHLALDEVSLEVPPGRSLAVVGPTGGGKSSLIRLLLRFYEPQEGTLYLGGRPLSAWGLKELRRSIGVIHQEVYVLEGTVRDNLTFGEQRIEDTFLKNCTEHAGLWPYIAKRGGLDMRLYEGGNNLSQGEKQLLSLARLLVRDTPVVVFDEATASIDPRLENILTQALEDVLKDRTRLIIAHRLSTVRNVDATAVMQEGRIVRVS